MNFVDSDPSRFDWLKTCKTKGYGSDAVEIKVFRHPEDDTDLLISCRGTHPEHGTFFFITNGGHATHKNYVEFAFYDIYWGIDKDESKYQSIRGELERFLESFYASTDPSDSLEDVLKQIDELSKGSPEFMKRLCTPERIQQFRDVFTFAITESGPLWQVDEIIEDQPFCIITMPDELFPCISETCFYDDELEYLKGLIEW